MEATNAPSEMTNEQWMKMWMERLQVAMKTERDCFHTLLSSHEQNPDAPLDRCLDPASVLESDLHCASIDETPLPYVLNVGCGFKPWSLGHRTRQGVPVAVVGVDPLAFGVGEALKVMATQFPELQKARCFIQPIVGEEMSAAFPPAAFNAVWSSDTLLDCVDPFRFLQQCVRATKVGGVVCVKFKVPSGEDDKPETLWRVGDKYNGSYVSFHSARGDLSITEVRGERIEVHTMLDGSLMLKIRRREHTQGDVANVLKRSGLVLAPTR